MKRIQVQPRLEVSKFIKGQMTSLVRFIDHTFLFQLLTSQCNSMKTVKNNMKIEVYMYTYTPETLYGL